MKVSTQQALAQAMLATAAYFDVLGVAVTPFELWRYSISPKRFGGQTITPTALTLAKVYELLEMPFLKERLGVTRGFMHLQGRAESAEARIAAAKQVAAKLKRVRVIIKRLRWVPFLHAVFLSGSVAVGHPVKKSDLDLLIVTAEGRLWLTRTLVTLTTFLMGVKRGGRFTRDRVCLNHYLTENHLAVPYPSLYNAMTYKPLLPLWEASAPPRTKAPKGAFGGGAPTMLEKFYQANQWLKDYLLAAPERDPLYRWQLQDKGWSRWLRSALERLLGGPVGHVLERGLDAVERRRIARDPRTHAPGGRVKISRYALEFHPDSPEKDVLGKYNRLLKNFGPGLTPEKDSGLKAVKDAIHR